MNKSKEQTEVKGVESIIIDNDILIEDFVNNDFYKESVDDEVLSGKAHQTLYNLSLNGIYPEFDEFIVLPSIKEAIKLKGLLAKLTPIS